MFSKFQKLLDRLANEPRYASRALAMFVVLASVTTLTFQLSADSMSNLLSGRLLNPLTVEEENNSARTTTQVTDGKFTSEMQTCHTRLIADEDKQEWKSFLKNFEDSFGGVLPGAGNLLLEHPQMVTDRKAALLFEVMKKYGEVKFCLPASSFRRTYGAEYLNDFSGALEPYMQAKNAIQEKNSTGSIKPIYSGDFKNEFKTMNQDMKETYAYVNDVIERAIDSAVELDRVTSLRVANFTAQTTNQFLNDIGKRQNEQIQIETKIGSLAEQIRNMIATNNYFGGTTNRQMSGRPYSGNVIASGLLSGSDKVSEFKSEMKPTRVSVGLLNLVNPSTATDFISARYPKEAALYLAATYWFDPVQPEGGNVIAVSSFAISDADRKKQMCELAGGKNGYQTCFGSAITATARSSTNPTVAPAASSSEAVALPSNGGATVNTHPDYNVPIPVDIRVLTSPNPFPVTCVDGSCN